jgi:DNA methylase
MPHSLNRFIDKVICGDARQILKRLPDNSIDSVVTDPPYGLRFMARSWDRFKSHSNSSQSGYEANGQYNNQVGAIEADPRTVASSSSGPQTFQEWCQAWAREVLRVLKPGGHLLAFGGNRTYHRLVCAIEDAGFEIRDSIHWTYGCLSDDTEILINGQWEPYHKAVEGSLALCYDLANDTFEWQTVKELLIYPYSDTAFKIESDSTDQIVSRNHRCIIERSGEYLFKTAERLEGQESIPVLESLSELLAALPLPDQRTSGEKQVLLSGMCGRAYETGQAIGTATTDHSFDRGQLCGLRDADEAAKGQIREATSLQLSVQRCLARAGMGETRPQGAGRLDSQEPSILQGEDERPEQSGLERRRYLLQNTRQLQGREVCQMSAGIHRDGSQGWLCNGASVTGRPSHRESLAALRSSASRQPRPDRQPPQESSVVCQQQRPQKIRASRFTRSDLARITPFHYQGIVWCVRMPSGAFVARRNGKVFITGNSGFPKSLDVSKAIDKAAGAKRRVIARKKHGQGAKITRFGQAECTEYIYSVSSSAESKRWQGWGTGLKPAHEAICVARKPLAEASVAANVLKYGTGAINIDACRITSVAYSKYVKPAGSSSWFYQERDHNPSETPHRGRDIYTRARGRWPSNFLLSHIEPDEDNQGGCQFIGKKYIKNAAGSICSARPRNNRVYGEDHSLRGDWEAFGNKDGYEEIPEYRCADNCPVAELDRQSGNPEKEQIARSNSYKTNSEGGSFQRSQNQCGQTGCGYASRFFKVFEPRPPYLYKSKPSTEEKNRGCQGLY